MPWQLWLRRTLFVSEKDAHCCTNWLLTLWRWQPAATLCLRTEPPIWAFLEPTINALE
jgi:hypothetical protein